MLSAPRRHWKRPKAGAAIRALARSRPASSNTFVFRRVTLEEQDIVLFLHLRDDRRIRLDGDERDVPGPELFEGLAAIPAVTAHDDVIGELFDFLCSRDNV